MHCSRLIETMMNGCIQLSRPKSLFCSKAALTQNFENIPICNRKKPGMYLYYNPWKKQDFVKFSIKLLLTIIIVQHILYILRNP